MTQNGKKPIRIGVMIGSESDLLQCEAGLQLLRQAERAGLIEFVVFRINSIHRNTMAVLFSLEHEQVDRWIVGAGMANHLTGTCDAYLRYGLNTTPVVYGAIFDVASEPEKNRQAAILSITQVPGTQVVFDPENPTFENACALAVEEEAPTVQIKAGKSFLTFRTINEAMDRIIEIKNC